MEDQEKALNLTNLCSSSAISSYPGAGANAVSRADGVFVTTPLSEVVWSPHEGLSIKRAEPSFIEKKAPILWSSEIFNIIISQPPAAGGGKSDSSKLMTRGDSTNVYLKTYSEDKICNEIASLGSPQNTISVVQSCPIQSHEHSPGTFQGMETLKDISLVDITRANDPSEDKDKGTSSPRKDQPIANNAWATSAVNSEGETGDSGPEDGRAADCLSHKLEEVVSNLAKVEAGYKNPNEESLQEPTKSDLEPKNNNCPAKDEALISDSSVFNKWNCPEDLLCTAKFKDGEQVRPEDIANEDCYNDLTSQVEKCAQTSELKDSLCCQHSSLNFFIEAKRDSYNQVMVVTSDPSNKRKECIYSLCPKEKTSLVESSFSTNVNPPDQCKGKEKVSSTERTRSVSKEKDDSYGSVKSSNNAEPFVTGKRAWSIGEEIFMGSKRMKRSTDENSCSGPHVREDSSFINWISSVSKGFLRCDHMETHSLAPVLNPVPDKQGALFSTSTSNDSNNVAPHRDVSFGSILKAFYWSRLKDKSKKIVNIDHLGESASSKELQLENLTIGRKINRVIDDSEGTILHNAVPISTVRIDQGICQFIESSPVIPGISVSKSHIRQKGKDNNWDHCGLRNVGSSNSSLRNGSSSPSEGKETSKVGSFVPNKSSNLSNMNKPGRIPASVWITRFSPKVAAPTECTAQCNQGTSLECEKQIDECSMLLHHSQKDIDPARDRQNSEDCHHSPLEDQKLPSENLQQYCISPMGVSCLKKVHTDLKANSNLNPILPSQKLKKLEPMTSVFAKRLDAFRNIQTSEVADDTTPENATCFFCGKNGHFITSCSDVTDSELEDLLKNINSLGRAGKSTRLCIRCFQHNHWAIVCPYASFSNQHADGNASIINCESLFRTVKGRSDAPFLTSHGVRICEKSEGWRHQVRSAHRICRGDMPRNATEFMLPTIVDVDKRSEMKGKQIPSTSREAEFGDKSYAHFHNLVINKKPDEQQRIFERIKKLRLSRTDIIRWLESSISHFSLEGFFLRVRLGKWEEGQGGMCYHVAFISGASEEKIYGGCKSHLPVNIGGSKCLIDSQFISNHDFVEDELKAWWSATLRRGGQLPSVVDLDKKLLEREMVDLYSQLDM